MREKGLRLRRSGRRQRAPVGAAAPTGRPPPKVTALARQRGLPVLFIEYDVTASGEIELVALIDAVEENGEDDAGTEWMAWRSAEFDDDGLGCVGVPPAELELMEQTEDPEQLRAIVERLILADRAAKESPS